MVPFRTSSIFRSRWIALIWSAGICWTAYNVASGADEPDAGAATQASPDEQVQLEDVAAAIERIR